MLPTMLSWSPLSVRLESAEREPSATLPVKLCDPSFQKPWSAVPNPFEKSTRRFAGVVLSLRSDERCFVAGLNFSRLVRCAFDTGRELLRGPLRRRCSHGRLALPQRLVPGGGRTCCRRCLASYGFLFPSGHAQVPKAGHVGEMSSFSGRRGIA